MGGVRRSGRLKKEISILLLGTNTSGRVFSEETMTVMLSRHGAGIISTHRLAPDEILTLRLLGSSKEAGVRLVGQMGHETRGYTYGVAFLDPDLDFWQIDFPPPSTWLTDVDHALECSLCHTCQIVHQSEIEADVYTIAEGILRYCESCGNSTLWHRAMSEGVTETPPPRLPVPQLGPNGAGSTPASSFYSGSLATTFSEPARTPAEKAVQVEVAPPAVLPAKAPPLAAMPVLWDHATNRRGGVRAGVTFMACIRHADCDEIVECDNISRGGLCFRSRKTYPVESVIEVAAPYSPGWHAIFVPACVRHVEQLPSGTLFRYGAAYTQPPKSARNS